MAPSFPSDKTGKRMFRIVKFWTEYRGTKDPIDMVEIAPEGPGFEKTRTAHRVDRLRPPEDVSETARDSLHYTAMVARWNLIGPAYEAWKAGNEIPDHGTPLAAWSGVSPEQAQALRQMGITTVEAVRDAGDATLAKLHMPNARQLPKLAGDFLSGADAASKDAKIAEMEDRIAAMAEMLEERTKRGPGRPKKETEAA